MSLRQQAHADLISIVESTTDFGWPITVTSPAGVSLAMTGLSNDIGTTLDPETGLPVSGRRASVALVIQSLLNGGLDIPHAVSERTSKPWRVTFEDLGGTSYTFKVIEAMPDRTLGFVTCLLERYVA